jgi:hypothetical protein
MAETTTMNDTFTISTTTLGFGLLPPWTAMCLAAFTIFFALKALTYLTAVKPAAATPTRKLGYLLAWPGLDAAAFLGDRKPCHSPTAADWTRTVATTTIGVAALLSAAYLAATTRIAVAPLAIGWLGMLGAILTLHLGTFRLAAPAWQTGGVAAEPIMDRPLAAATLAEFWDRRWNKAFRDVAHRWVFEPLVRRVGPRSALVAGFAASGLVHEVVISLPAGAGFGLPTAYFLLQAGAILFTRSRLGLRLGVRRGPGARVFAAVMLVAPLGLLFHPPFVRMVVVPMFVAAANLH